jgi:hypothetical protein
VEHGVFQSATHNLALEQKPQASQWNLTMKYNDQDEAASVSKTQGAEVYCDRILSDPFSAM